jgi:hypothetical protein
MRSTIHVIATTPEGTAAAMSAAGPAAVERQMRVRLLVPETRPADRDPALHVLIPAGATVYVGGRIRRWWRTAEQRLALRLQRAGRDVVFVPADV